MAAVMLDIDNAESLDHPPASQIQQWLTATFEHLNHPGGQVALSIVTENTITELNTTYRNQNKPTNVLSFPFEFPPGLPADAFDLQPLGDMVICPMILKKEADQQQKTILDHWAHLIIHSTLHLLHYDHQTPDQANIMENLEIIILKKFKIANPYQEHCHD